MVVGETILDTQVLVIGGGPGGYTAAIHAADLGKDVVLVESRKSLGGVCLTEGCIPSKAIIHVTDMARDGNNAKNMGLEHGGISINLERLRKHVSDTVDTLSAGVDSLVANRDIERVTGHARFQDGHSVYVDGANTIIRFEFAVIATGSSVNKLPPGIASPSDALWTSAQALALPEIPGSLLVIGGGYIGLEIGQAYAGLGSRVTLVEAAPELLPAADPDLAAVVLNACEADFDAVYTDARVTRIESVEDRFAVTIVSGEQPPFEERFDRVLAATGRHPDTDNLNLKAAGLDTDEQGHIPTGETCRTRVAHIFAVGDAAPGPALAHKAAREGKVAAEVICGQVSAFDNVTVPAVLFTRPEVAWAGITEKEARAGGWAVRVGKFPLSALGRARSTGKTQGFVKIIALADTGRILGVGVVGYHASDLIAEGVLAIEMGATLEDLMVTIHPHPTFSEALMEAAEMASGGSVHMIKKR